MDDIDLFSIDSDDQTNVVHQSLTVVDELRSPDERSNSSRRVSISPPHFMGLGTLSDSQYVDDIPNVDPRRSVKKRKFKFVP